ncbi:hypothetical protein CABS01_03576 [Colletotrichum abscissum]|uniref:Uncharacterized protein n=2 Tax=Colletotrichum acutatum species complex TaxID=2707335 RepID=A0A9Q0B9Z7_9PEZI|nr:uncharacterized protein CTAM01_02740 [Colletotrichum tamarilloi]XP_060391209.1 uncharacterized protein CABS01_03576 [Colletotrichum abscissum]KAI3549342.1 hypothetical protein CSPX01_02450 [Colletotrichum filicis]KAI3559594.1 hypothetical protein CABS02_00569 [Colletotrichum abscissum]KAK1475299.1 hypothetical protein CABS01_03576 [Colletotrichum abscissum]KAK1507628.1 hypothetical protein CTAM01_02740 [Colletotrichum tamarilloi]
MQYYSELELQGAMIAIAGLGQLSASQQRMCDDLLQALIPRNYPVDPETLDNVRREFWNRVFAKGWTTNKENKAPGQLPKRTNDEASLTIGTLNQDVPKNGSVPGYRRAGQSVLLKVSMKVGDRWEDVDASFFWVDQQGHRGSELSNASIDIEGDLTLEEASVEVGMHYDTNEKERVGGWNWDKVVYWGRLRLLNLALQLRVANTEDTSELKQVRLVEEHWLEKEELRKNFLVHEQLLRGD